MAPPRIGSASSHPPSTAHAARAEAPRTTHGPTAAPRSAPPHHADTFGAGDHARDGALRHATGRDYDEQVTQGTMHAVEMAHRPVDFDHPEQALHDHSQLDASGRTTGDESRCGATALVGGLVLSGHEAPQRLHGAREREQARLTEVEHGLHAALSQSAMSAPDPLGGGAPSYAQGLRDAEEARRMLDGLPDSPHASWTHEQLSQFEEATYRLGRAEQALHGDGVAPSHTGLSGGELVRLRDTVWGDGWQPRTSDGHRVDVVFAGERTAQGSDLHHFVLGTDDLVAGGRRALVYDPWPADDGTAFCRVPGGAERLLGGAAESGRLADGSFTRPGEDIDVFRAQAQRHRVGPTLQEQLDALTSRP